MNEEKINKKLKIPYYYQLYEKLAGNINSNILTEGSKLPGEMSLCDKFGVSRITVRQALQELEANGYIIREKGKGTFIRDRIETHSLQKVSSIVDELRREGISTEKSILINTIIEPDERISRIISSGNSNKTTYIKRLIFASGAPLYITKAYFPYEVTGKIQDRILIEKSFTNIITRILNLKLLHSKRILEPVIPDTEVREDLNLGVGSIVSVHYLQTFWTVNHITGPRTLYFEEFFNPSKGRFVFERDY